jgi:hypothetical protein
MLFSENEHFQLTFDPHQTHAQPHFGGLKLNLTCKSVFIENKPPKSYFFPNKLPKSYFFPNKLLQMSLSKVWNENTSVLGWFLQKKAGVHAQNRVYKCQN